MKEIEFSRTDESAVVPDVVTRAIDRLTIEGYLKSHDTRKLQLGCGSNVLRGWLNTDLRRGPGVLSLDVTQPFPLPASAFHYIFSEHLIEHLPYVHAGTFLAECRRCLVPGGKIRISTPDLLFLTRLYEDALGDIEQRYISWHMNRFFDGKQDRNPVFVINDFFYMWGHRMIYDFKTLDDLLGQVGFVESRRYMPGNSDESHLRGVEGHGRIIGEEFNELESMVIEARKRP